MQPTEGLIAFIILPLLFLSFIILSVTDIDNRGCYKRIWIGIGIVVLMGIIGIIVSFIIVAVKSGNSY